MNTFEYFFQHSQEFCCIINLDGYFENINPVFEKLLGYSQNELVKSNFSSFIHPDDIQATQLELEKLKNGTDINNFENRFRKKDNKYVWLEWNATPDTAAGKIYAIARNISERKITTETLKEREISQRKMDDEKVENNIRELRNSKQQIQAIFDNAPDPVIVIDDNSTIIKWNPKAETVFGWGTKEVIGKPLYEFIIPARYRENHIAGMKQVVTKGNVTELRKNYEVEAINKQGIEFPVSMSISSFLNEGNYFFIGFVRDISENKKIAAEKLIMAEELKRSNTELEQFAYIASHDLQEPLRMITSYLQLLEKRYKDKLDQDAKDFISFAVDGSNRMRALIHSLLEYSRINRVKPFEEINPNLLLNDVLKNISISIKENNVTINIDELPIIYGDPVLINLLFQNLIENAIKFRNAKNPEIHISVKEELNEFQFAIKDNGIGIQKEYLDKIFVIFKRLHSRESYPGTGMGLAICKKIVERHGGRIWVESEFGQGSTFYFTIKKKMF